jgi:hypothetical protein
MDAIDARDKVITGEHAVAAEALLKTTHNDPAVFEALAKADPKIAKAIHESEEVRALKGKLDAAATELKGPKTEAEKLTGGIAKETKKLLDKAAGELKSLSGLENEKGFVAALRKPGRLLVHGSGKQKFGVLASAIVLGGATYAGIKAFSGKDKSGDETFAEGVDNSRAAGTPGVGAAK